MTRLHLPDLGEGLEEAEVVAWLVAEGDEVARDQPLVEVETDKAVVQIPSPVAGRVSRLGAPAGARIRVGDLLVAFDGGGGDADAGGAGRPAAVPPAGAAPPPGSGSPAARPARPKAAPAVRKLAADLGVDLAAVAATGPGGRVTADDVRAAAAGREQGRAGGEPAPAPGRPGGAPAAGSHRRPLRGLRRRIAEVMAEAWSAIPHVTTMDEVDASRLVEARQRLSAEAGDRGPALTLAPFLVMAAARALRRFPELNASLDLEHHEVVLHGDVHVGVAVATDDGLVVPVVRHADRRSLLDLAGEVERLAGGARSRTLPPDDLRGGTFTVTNFGALGGGRFATPIIRPPEVAIVGFGAVATRPVVADGEVVARPTLPMSLSFDHRLVDGDLAGAYFRHLAGMLADPLRLLLEG